MFLRTRLSLPLAIVLVLAMASSVSAIIINDKDGKRYALLPLASGEVGRINVTNVGELNIDNSCAVKVTIFAADGSVIGDPGIKEVRPGLTEFFDFSDRTIPLGGRRTFRARIEVDRTIPPGPCIAQEEVFDRLTGRTQIVGDPKVLPQMIDPPEPESPGTQRLVPRETPP